jgi:general secretion pathway protein D
MCLCLATYFAPIHAAAKKTNLMVFLRPVVVRDGASTENLSLSRYEQMRSVQMEVQPTATPGMPAIGSPVLPENTRKP